MSDNPLPPETPCPPADLLADCLQEVEETIDRLAELLAEARGYAATFAGNRTSPEA